MQFSTIKHSSVIRQHLNAPITDKESAKSWIRSLVLHDMAFHLEDDPAEIISGATSEMLFTAAERTIVRDRVAKLYGMKWTKREGGCPIGYMMKVEKTQVQS
jgi:hypothetical protein